MKFIKKIGLLLLAISVLTFTSCSDDDHDHDHDGEEAINEVNFIFTPSGGGNQVTARWFDADGDGAGNPTKDQINLAANTTYELSLELANTLEGEDKTSEVQAEGDEHMFFFEFTTDIFSNPAGNGNADTRGDAINYNDQDDNGLPLGLSTTWTTGDATTSTGTFRIILKHQPGLKTATSDIGVGGTDLDITLDIVIN